MPSANYELSQVAFLILIPTRKGWFLLYVRMMSPTEAQIRARKKYREKQEYLQTRVSPEEKLAIAEHVNAINESLSEFIRRAIAETMARDKASEKFDPK